MNKQKIAQKLLMACEILQNQKYAIQRDLEYPLPVDIIEIAQAKSLIDEAELLLKGDESKQPQPPDFANTMLGEVPHVVNAQSEESLKAVEGATPVVRQNEQTKEVCPTCLKDDLYYKSGGARYCSRCFKWS